MFAGVTPGSEKVVTRPQSLALAVPTVGADAAQVVMGRNELNVDCRSFNPKLGRMTVACGGGRLPRAKAGRSVEAVGSV